MGYDAGILLNSDAPTWPYLPGYAASREEWKKDTNPVSWLRDSVVWYSQVLVGKLGAEKFQKYVDAFEYGNRDLNSLGPLPANGLAPAVWLNSSLKVSAVEQIAFIRKLLGDALPVSQRAMAQTRAIMPSISASDGWSVHGKTGAGYQPAKGAGIDPERQFGWFVGWAEKEGRRVVFARLIKDDERVRSVASLRARDTLLADLPTLLKGR